MPILVEKLHGEPILVLTYSGTVQAQDVIDAQATSLALVEGLKEKIYRINNTLPINLTFGEMVLILGESAASRPGSGRDSRFVDSAVVNAELARLGVQALSQAQYGSLNIQMFEDLDSALAHARQAAAG